MLFSFIISNAILLLSAVFDYGAAYCNIGIDANIWTIRPGYELVGHDLDIKVHSSTGRACAFICSRNDRCRSFNFVPATGECQMKSTFPRCYELDLIKLATDTVYLLK